MKLLCKSLGVMDPSLRWGDELICSEDGRGYLQAPFPFCMIENRAGDYDFVGLGACLERLYAYFHSFGRADGTGGENVVQGTCRLRWK